MGTIREYFEKAFHGTACVHVPHTATVGAVDVEMRGRVHLDFVANAVFLSCWVPPVDKNDLATIVIDLLSHTRTLVRFERNMGFSFPSVEHLVFGVGFSSDRLRLTFETPDGVSVNSSQFGFTRRLYVYTAAEPTEECRLLIEEAACNLGLIVSLRGPSYATEMDKRVRPAVFISHDSRDKESLATEIARRLQDPEYPVWYDEFSLNVGDSLRESIERGLKQCRFCILILTPNFLSKGGWPRLEYDAAFTRELLENTNVILPVWHNVSREDVFAYSPTLAARVAVQWSLGVDEVCKKLVRAMRARDLRRQGDL